MQRRQRRHFAAEFAAAVTAARRRRGAGARFVLEAERHEDAAHEAQQRADGRAVHRAVLHDLAHGVEGEHRLLGFQKILDLALGIGHRGLRRAELEREASQPRVKVHEQPPRRRRRHKLSNHLLVLRLPRQLVGGEVDLGFDPRDALGVDRGEREGLGRIDRRDHRTVGLVFRHRIYSGGSGCGQARCQRLASEKQRRVGCAVTSRSFRSKRIGAKHPSCRTTRKHSSTRPDL